MFIVISNRPIKHYNGGAFAVDGAKSFVHLQNATKHADKEDGDIFNWDGSETTKLSESQWGKVAKIRGKINGEV